MTPWSKYSGAGLLRQLARLLGAACLASLLCVGSLASAQTNEFRGWFADAWGAGFQNSNQTRQLIADARAGNFNAVVAQVRRRGDAFYNSNFEPRNAGLSAGYDPLADLVARAHDTNSGPRLEIHAWVVTYHIWQGTTPPPQPTHPLNLHPDWLLKDFSGNTLIGNEYTFDPGHPEVQKFTYNVCMDLLTNYDVDGLNFDYIRYASTSEGYNDVTVARFNRLFGRTGIPATSDAAWTQFRRDQVTALLRKIYLNALALKPNVKISCDTITQTPGPANDAAWYSSSAAWTSVLQDWRGWMQEGILDLNLPMAYFDQAGAYTLAWTNWCNFTRDHRFSRHAAITAGTYLNAATNALTQLRYTRAASPTSHTADGLAVYNYRTPTADGLSLSNFVGALTQPGIYDPIVPPLFEQAVQPAPMPWKTAPTKGHLKGFVYAADSSTALDGAVVRLSGAASRAQTNDATGFYGFVDLAPGNYSVWASYQGYQAQTNSVVITTGQVTTIDLVLETNGPPLIRVQPANQSIYQGGSASFSIAAGGAKPMTYQWSLNTTNLPGATNSTCMITHAQPEQAGSYAVVVSNKWGSIISSNAFLTVQIPIPPQLGAPTFSADGTIRLSGSGETGTFTLLYSTNLVDWQNLQPVPSSNGAFQWLDNATNNAQRFYRVLWGP